MGSSNIKDLSFHPSSDFIVVSSGDGRIKVSPRFLFVNVVKHTKVI